MGYYDESNIGNIKKAAENERKKMECSLHWQKFKAEIKVQWYLFLFITISLTTIFFTIVTIGWIDYNFPFSHIVQLFTLLFTVVSLSLVFLGFLMVLMKRTNTNPFES